jgi:hypothetical protein
MELPHTSFLQGIHGAPFKAFRGINGAPLRATPHLFHGALTGSASVEFPALLFGYLQPAA